MAAARIKIRNVKITDPEKLSDLLYPWRWWLLTVLGAIIVTGLFVWDVMTWEQVQGLVDRIASMVERR